MSSIMGVDPLQIVTEALVIALFALVICFMWRHWNRVLMVLTPGGDDRIHCTTLDCIWVGLFHCCGTCSGDWTRAFTRWWCCPRLVRGQNVVKLLGQFMGFTTVTVELKNLIVGDLPFEGHGNFYVSVEVQNNPPMCTSVAEERHGKAVHFPEILTLKLCKNLLEMPLTIRVFELNPIFGHEELCACHLSAMQILQWSDDQKLRTNDPSAEKVMRFQMKPKTDGPERETPPWILLEIDQPQEARQLHEWHGAVDTVRTTTLSGDVLNTNIADYKHQYTLLDPNGQATQEPLEQDLQEIELVEWVMQRVQSLIMFCLTWASLGYLATRAYAWSCYRQYTQITMAAMNGLDFPVPKTVMKQMVVACSARFEGTGAAEGIPCRPSSDQVQEYCLWPEEGGDKFPANAKRPLAFAKLMEDTFGIEIQGLTCRSGVCDLRNRMVGYDHWIPVAILGPLLLNFFMKWACRRCIHHKKRAHQSEAAKATQAMQLRRQAQKTRGAFGAGP